MIEPQLFVGSEPRAGHFTEVTNDTGFGVKPLGGMWTSTFDPEVGSDWIRWCHAEDFRVPGGGWRSWLVQPAWDLHVLTIDTLEDLVLALNKYARPPFEWQALDRAFTSRYFDFEKLAHDYDAVHLTEEGQWRTRGTSPGSIASPDNLYGWDCESVLWLRWRVSSVAYLGRKTWRDPPPPYPKRGRLRTARGDL